MRGDLPNFEAGGSKPEISSSCHVQDSRDIYAYGGLFNATRHGTTAIEKAF